MRRHPGNRRPRRIVLLGTILIGLSLTAAPPAAAGSGDPQSPSFEVVEWNKYAYEALVNGASASPPGAGQAPLVAQLHLAMVHGAVFEAVPQQQRPGHGQWDHQPPYSAAAAAVAAAHGVLDGVLDPTGQQPTPATARLDQLYEAEIAASRITDGDGAVDAGIAAGTRAATEMLEKRANDGRFVPLPLKAGTLPGEWRPELPAFVSDPNAWVSKVTPFTLRSAQQFRSAGPHPLSSAAYARDFNEVKSLGGKVSRRTAEQEALAEFFDTNSVEIFNRTFRDIAVQQQLSLSEQARLFALIDTATADSLITCWAEKVKWGFWRPITAIHLADTDGNRRTSADLTWSPRIDTPPYSDHTSGFNCISGAMMTIGKIYFGTDRMSFTMQKMVAGKVVGSRQYNRFSDVIADVIDVRVLHGVHFRTADVDGAEIGEDVAQWVARIYRR